MKSQGVPCKKANFHRVVHSWTGEPEYQFSNDKKSKLSRQADMWFSPCGLLVEQAKGHKIIIPTANVVYAIPL